MKKKFIIFVILTAIAVVASAAAVIATNTSTDNGKTGNLPVDETHRDELDGREYEMEQIVISGIVVKKDLEGGYFELDGFRLTGEFDFA